jgi:hypothetical protein
MAVSPVSELGPKMADPGLHWLHELSYRQVWRLRRRWAHIHGAAADFNQVGPTLGAVSVTIVVGQTADPIMTMRRSEEYNHSRIQSQRYFNPLEDEATLRRVVGWFQENLDRGTS